MSPEHVDNASTETNAPEQDRLLAHPPGLMEIDAERRKTGQEIKRYLKVNRISRDEFCHLTKLGKSTVDKLCTGIFSDATLQIVLERTKFVRSNSFAADHLGRYSRESWSSYLGEHLLLMPSLNEADAIDALKLAIEWDENLPGMVLVHAGGSRRSLGHLTIPHERSPLIYIAAAEGYGRNLETGSDIYQTNLDLAVRSKWVWTPTDDDTVHFIFDFERRYGSFYRVIPLPDGASVDQAKAKFENGVLEVTFPLAEETRERRRIQVEGSGAAPTETPQKAA